MTEYRALSFLGLDGYRVGSDGSFWTRLAIRSKGNGGGTTRYLGSKWRRLSVYYKPHHINCPRCTGGVVGLGRRRRAFLHDLILQAFVGSCPEGMCACYKNGDRTDLRLENLWWSDMGDGPYQPETCYKQLTFMGWSNYRVGSDGSIWIKSSIRWRRKATTIDKDGYVRVSFGRSGEQRSFAVHRLVLLAFMGPCPPGMECRHLDGNPSNNHVDNLLWDTHKNNIADKVRHGTNNNTAKTLTIEQVKAMRLLSSFGFNAKEVKKFFPTVSYDAVWRVTTRRTWGHVQ